MDVCTEGPKVVSLARADPKAITASGLIVNRCIRFAHARAVVLQTDDCAVGRSGIRSQRVYQMAGDAYVLSVIPGRAIIVADEQSTIGAKEEFRWSRKRADGRSMKIGVCVREIYPGAR